MAKHQAAVNAQKLAVVGQDVRSGVTGSLSTHSTNRIYDWMTSFFSSSQQQSQDHSSVTTSQCDSLPNGTQNCHQ